MKGYLGLLVATLVVVAIAVVPVAAQCPPGTVCSADSSWVQLPAAPQVCAPGMPCYGQQYATRVVQPVVQAPTVQSAAYPVTAGYVASVPAAYPVQPQYTYVSTTARAAPVVQYTQVAAQVPVYASVAVASGGCTCEGCDCPASVASTATAPPLATRARGWPRLFPRIRSFLGCR